jgi:hypothetical protein
VNYSATTGTGHGAANKDQNYGDANAAAIIASSSVGPNSAAAYCDNLVYGGYSDWYLPNRYELNLFFTNKASIPGLRTTGASVLYWSSTEYNTGHAAWAQRYSDGYQDVPVKSVGYLVRCVRRF